VGGRSGIVRRQVQSELADGRRPLQLGGLGVLDLKSFARALRVRWLWQEQSQPDKHWVGIGTPCTEVDKLLFAACTTTHIGDGLRISFWHSAWARGRRPKDIAPSIYNASRKKNRSLSDAILDHAWVKDLNVSACLTVGHLQEFIALWFEVQEVRLQRDAQDRVTWKLTAFGEYDSASAYRAQFLGSVKFDLRWLIWKPWAPTKCKFFA